MSLALALGTVSLTGTTASADPGGSLEWSNGSAWSTTHSLPGLSFGVGRDSDWTDDQLNAATVSVTEGGGDNLCGDLYWDDWNSDEFTARFYCYLTDPLAEGSHELWAAVTVGSFTTDAVKSTVTVDTSGTLQWSADQAWTQQAPNPTFSVFTRIGANFDAEAAAASTVTFVEETYDYEAQSSTWTTYCESDASEPVDNVVTYACSGSGVAVGLHSYTTALLNWDGETAGSNYLALAGGSDLYLVAPVGTLTWSNGSAWSTTDSQPTLYVELSRDSDWTGDQLSAATLSVTEDGGDNLCGLLFWDDWISDEFTARFHCYPNYLNGPLLSEGSHDLWAAMTVGDFTTDAVKSTVTVDTSGVLRWSDDQEWTQRTPNPTFSVFTRIGANFDAEAAAESTVTFVEETYDHGAGYRTWTTYCESAASEPVDNVVTYACSGSGVAVGSHNYTIAVLNWDGETVGSNYSTAAGGSSLHIGAPVGTLTWSNGSAWSTADSRPTLYVELGRDSDWTDDQLNAATVSVTEDGGDNLCAYSYWAYWNSDEFTARFYCYLTDPLSDGSHELWAAVTVGSFTTDAVKSTVTVDTSGTLQWSAGTLWTQQTQRPTFSVYTTIGAWFSAQDASEATVSFLKLTWDNDNGNYIYTEYCQATDSTSGTSVATFACEAADDVEFGNHDYVFAVLNWDGSYEYYNYNYTYGGPLKLIPEPLGVTVTSDPITLVYGAQYPVDNPNAPEVVVDVTGLTEGKHYAAVLVAGDGWNRYSLGDNLSVYIGCGGPVPVTCSTNRRPAATPVVEATGTELSFSVPYSNGPTLGGGLGVATSDTWQVVVVEITGENPELFNPAGPLTWLGDSVDSPNFPSSVVVGIADATVNYRHVGELISVAPTASIVEDSVDLHHAEVSVEYSIDSSIWDDVTEICGTTLIYRMFGFSRLPGQVTGFWGEGISSGEGSSRLWNCLDNVVSDLDESDEAEAARARYRAVNHVFSGYDASYSGSAWYEQWYNRSTDYITDLSEASNEDSIVIPLAGLLENTTYGNWGYPHLMTVQEDRYPTARAAVYSLTDDTPLGDTVADPAAMLLAGINVVFNDGAIYRLAPGKESVVDNFTTTSINDSVALEYPDEDAVLDGIEELDVTVTATVDSLYVAGEEQTIYLDDVPEDCTQAIEEGSFCFWDGFIYSEPTRLTSLDGGSHLIIKWTYADGYYTNALIPLDYDGEHVIALFDQDGELKAAVVLSDAPPVPTYDISLSQSGPYTFPVQPVGYDAQTPLEVTVTNTGNQETGALTVALAGDSSSSFELSSESLVSIPAEGTDSFTVVPKPGLGVGGPYTATVTVTDDTYGSFAEFDVTFTVDLLPVASIASVSFTVDTAPVGYTLQPTVTGLDPANAVLTYQWLRNDSPIEGMTGSSYELVDADAGKSITVTVTASADGYSSASKTSGAVSVPAPPPVYHLTVNGGSGSGNYVAGESVQIIANNPTSGQVFDKWVVTGSGTVSDPTAVVTTFAMPAAPTTVTATYKDAPTYGVSLNKSGAQTFPAALVGYGAQTPLSVTVTNTGNQATGALGVALSGANASSFALSSGSVATIAAAGTGSFTVVPKSGLGVGTYTATVTVTGGNAISATFSVTFTVAPLPTYVLTVSGGSGSGSYAAGASVPIVAGDAPSGQVFDKWVVVGGGTVTDVHAESTTFLMPGNAASVTATYKAAGPDLSNAAHLWRFYNSATGAHFYSGDVAERDYILGNLPQFSLEGSAGQIIAGQAASESSHVVVHRFYLPGVGVHFYSADPAEVAYVKANLSAKYSYEGASYVAYTRTPDEQGCVEPGTVPFFRFYNHDTGVHFYTADPDEKAYVVNTYDYASGKGAFELESIAYCILAQ
ncbi:MAG: hypothetical protein LBM94_03020 [Propionibacteriaceae bacterium]|nr:hypothetical protein [Propionibacteriaceae bacterium]